LLALGRLYTLGHTIDWSVLSPEGGQCVSLPTYPWQRKRLWLDWLTVEEISSPPESRTQERPDQIFSREEQNLTLSQLLATTPTDQWYQLLLDHLTQELASLFEVDPGVVQKSQSFFSLGMDSLTATKLINRLQKHLGVLLPATAIFSHPSVEPLADYLTNE